MSVNEYIIQAVFEELLLKEKKKRKQNKNN